SDLLTLLDAAVDDRLDELGPPEWDDRPAVCVVMASKGYPGSYEKGYAIEGLAEAAKLPDVKVFHAGTRRDGERVVTDGGRGLGARARGAPRAAPRRRAYEAAAVVKSPGAFYRHDIGARAVGP